MVMKLAYWLDEMWMDESLVDQKADRKAVQRAFQMAGLWVSEKAGLTVGSWVDC
jgi:hypothetical protein